MYAARSLLCALLCCVMVFVYSYREPCEAHAEPVTTVTVVGAVAVACALGALGIAVSGVVSGQSYEQVCQDIWNSIDNTAKNAVTAVAATTIGMMATYQLGTNFIKAVGDTFKAKYDSATAATSLPNGAVLAGAFTGTQLATFLGLPDGSKIRNGWSYNYAQNAEVMGSNLNIGNKITLYKDMAYTTFAIGSTSYWVKYLQQNTNSTTMTMQLASMQYDWGNMVTTSLSQTYYTAQYFYNGYIYDALLPIERTVGTSIGWGWVVGKHAAADASAVPAAPGKDVYGLGLEKVFADGMSALNNKVDDVINRLKEKTGVTAGDGSVSVPVDVPSDKVDDKLRDKTATQEKTVGKDIATTADKTANTTTNTGKNTQLPKPPGLPDLSVPQILKDKFPFCIPWDVYRIISGFYCATMATPHWEIPFQNARLGINSKLVIDFSQFNDIAKMARFFNGAAWVFALILVTRKLIGAGGGD
jgi:hypothetical protein